MGKWDDRNFKPYFAWYQAKKRCHSSNHPQFSSYGMRGIKMCDNWRGMDGFKNFLQDMGYPKSGESLDRIDNNGDYTPENCRWATKYQQARNKRNNVSDVCVNYDKSRKKWRAIVTIDGICVYRKRFSDKSDAIVARNKVWKKYGVYYG